MKSFGCFALLLFLITTAHAELDTLWTRIVDLSESSYAIEAATVLHDATVMAYCTHSTEGVLELWRFSWTGEQIWTGTVSFPSTYVTPLGIAQLADGQIMILVTYLTQNDSGNSVHVKRINLEGEVLGDDVYNLRLYDNRVGIEPLSDNSLVLYYTHYDFNGTLQATLTKLDSNGDSLWSRFAGPVETYVIGKAVRELSNGDLVLAGAVSPPDFSLSAFVMRMTATGQVVWTRSFPNESGFGLAANSLDIDRAGNIIAGGDDGNMWWLSRPWAVGLTGSGETRWLLSGLESEDIGIYGVRALPGGGAILLGTRWPDFGFPQAKIYTISPSGAGTLELGFSEVYSSQFSGFSNHRSLGAIGFGGFNDNQNTRSGMLFRFRPTTIITGVVRAQGSNQPIRNVRVEMLETGEYAVTDQQGVYTFGVSLTNGTIRLTSPCSTPAQEAVELEQGEVSVRDFTVAIPTFVNPVSSVNLVVTLDMWEHDTLSVYNEGNGALSFWSEAVQLSPSNYEWLRVAPTSGEIQPNSSAEIIVSFGVRSDQPETELYGRIRIHHNACPDTVNEVGVYILALDSPEQPSPVESFALHPAYPNPFNNTARVSFDLPQSAQVQAMLYSIDGREVQSVANSRFTAGSHQLTLNGENLATGVYILRLTANSAVATQKLVLLK